MVMVRGGGMRIIRYGIRRWRGVKYSAVEKEDLGGTCYDGVAGSVCAYVHIGTREIQV